MTQTLYLVLLLKVELSNFQILKIPNRKISIAFCTDAINCISIILFHFHKTHKYCITKILQALSNYKCQPWEKLRKQTLERNNKKN